MMNPKLNQIIAVVTGKKTRATKLLTEAHHDWGKENLLNGLSRSYKPLDQEGEHIPPEDKKVQVRVKDSLKRLLSEIAEFQDAVATQEWGNTIAKADVIVDGKDILIEVPVSVLLFLEKQLTDLHTFISNLPTLPSDKVWKWDDAQNCFATDVTEQLRMQKVPTTHVLFEPTQHQPGQAQIINIDKAVGTWSTRHFSGALPGLEQSDMLERVEKLQDAVKAARADANSTVVEQKKIGENVLGFIFGK